MILCKDCKYWDGDNFAIGVRDLRSRDLRSYVDFRQCSMPRFRKGYNIRAEDLAANEVLVEDDEGWGFFTGPDFGCIHAEANARTVLARFSNTWFHPHEIDKIRAFAETASEEECRAKLDEVFKQRDSRLEQWRQSQ